jgi:hypothetical protein
MRDLVIVPLACLGCFVATYTWQSAKITALTEAKQLAEHALINELRKQKWPVCRQEDFRWITVNND